MCVCVTERERVYNTERVTERERLREREREMVFASPASHVATAYTRRYILDVGGHQGHDQYLLMHPNGLVLVGLAPSHPLFRRSSSSSSSSIPIKLIAVDYELGGARKVAAMPTGKRKRGGDIFTADDVVCQIRARSQSYRIASSSSSPVAAAHDDDDDDDDDDNNNNERDREEKELIFEPRACIRGKVLEVNDSLLDVPSPLMTQCGSNGYLCVLLPRDEDYEEAKRTMLTPAQYAAKRGEFASEEMRTNGMREKTRGPAVVKGVS